jgi:hypothetical protein
VVEVVATGTQVVLVALVVAALEVSFPVSTPSVVALAQGDKATPAALDETLKVTLSATAVAAAVLEVVVKMQLKILAALALAVLALLTLFARALPRHMLAVAGVVLLPLQVVAVVVAVLAVVATATIALVAVQLPEGPILVAVVVVLLQARQLRQVVPVSSWFATALHNFSTGETHETIDSGHRCGTDLDGLRYKPRRLLRCHCCA